MGIKFYCPNGHKVHVKSFLAGRKGKCPKCGISVRIPTEPEVGVVADDDEIENIETQAAGSMATRLDEPLAIDAGAAAVGPVQPPALPHGRSGGAAPPQVDDPIAAAPEARWYVTIRTGERFGPARGELLREWIADRRVTADCMVWREGWSDWQSAGRVLAEFRGINGFADELDLGGSGLPVVAESSPATWGSRKRRPNGMQSGSSMLLLFAIVLGVVLVFVLWAPWR